MEENDSEEIQSRFDATATDEDLDTEESKSPVNSKIGKERKAGIVYLSTVPPGMNIKQIRDYFGEFGEVNRSFLQPDKKGWRAKGKPKNQTFIEGWIEFRKRRHAKRAAVTLNNNPVGGKKRKIYHDFLWNIKYLPGFQWVHLNERLAYERISLKQRLRTEISAVKRETDFFSKSVDLSKKLKRQGIIGKGSKNVKEEPSTSSTEDSKGRSIADPEVKLSQPPASSIREKQNVVNSDRASFFKSLFAKSD